MSKRIEIPLSREEVLSLNSMRIESGWPPIPVPPSLTLAEAEAIREAELANDELERLEETIANDLVKKITALKPGESFHLSLPEGLDEDDFIDLVERIEYYSDDYSWVWFGDDGIYTFIKQDSTGAFPPEVLKKMAEVGYDSDFIAGCSRKESSATDR
jgi:hypothetical protein